MLNLESRISSQIVFNTIYSISLLLHQIYDNVYDKFLAE